MSLYGIEKPGLLTPTGWEGVQKYVREEPDYMVIDDGITPYAASLMNKDIPSEEIAGPVDKIIPVDAKVPGCAVRPQDIVAGLVSALPLILDAE